MAACNRLSLLLAALMLCSAFVIPATRALELSQFDIDFSTSGREEIDDDEEEDTSEQEEFDRENLVGEVWFTMSANNDRAGPMYFEDLKRRFFKGEVSLLTKVWRHGWERWRMFKTIEGVRKYLQEDLDVKQRIQLMAVDDKRFIRSVKRIEGKIAATSAMDMAMTCIRQSALGEVLRTGIVKRLLRDLLNDVRTSDIERRKLKKVLRAFRHQLAREEAEHKEALEPLRVEAAKFQKAHKLLEQKASRQAQGADFSGLMDDPMSFLATEVRLLGDAFQKYPEELTEPILFLLAVLLAVATTLNLFVSVLRTPVRPAPAMTKPKPAANAGKKKSKETKAM